MSIQLSEKNASLNIKQAEFNILFEDDKTKITSWRFEPGAETGWHYHGFDYVTIQQSGGTLQLENDAGDIFTVDYEAGRTVRYNAPVRHNATNISAEEIRVIEIEYKV